MPCRGRLRSSIECFGVNRRFLWNEALYGRGWKITAEMSTIVGRS